MQPVTSALLQAQPRRAEIQRRIQGEESPRAALAELQRAGQGGTRGSGDKQNAAAGRG